MKHMLKITILFSLIVILFGFYELSYRNDIFAQSKALCCNEGMCYYNSKDPSYSKLCSSSSSMKIKPECGNDYLFDCKTCVDLSAAGRICGDPKNSCKDSNGNCYGWCLVNGVWQWTNPVK